MDGVDLTGQIGTLVARGEVAPSVPFLSGAVREDLGFTIFDRATIQCSPDACTGADLWRFVGKLALDYGWPAGTGERVAEMYMNEPALPGGNYTRWYWAAKHLGADYHMVCPARSSVRSVGAALGGEGGAGAYLYFFAHAPDGPSGAYPSLAHHASEIPFVFHDETARGPNAPEFHVSRRELPLAGAMAGAWATFAATGRPPAAWPPYARDEAWYVFGDGGGAVRHRFKHDKCDLWDRIQGANSVLVEPAALA